MKKHILLMPALLVVAMPIIVSGEDAAPTETIAPPTCKKPLLTTRMRKADDDSDFNEKFETYQACIKTYANEQNKAGQKHIDAANAAVADFNAFVRQASEAQQQNK